MKEYIRRIFLTNDAEKKINELASKGWEIVHLDEAANSVFVWMKRSK